jgi:hypothetical protein
VQAEDQLRGHRLGTEAGQPLDQLGDGRGGDRRGEGDDGRLGSGQRGGVSLVQAAGALLGRQQLGRRAGLVDPAAAPIRATSVKRAYEPGPVTTRAAGLG